MKKIKLLLVSFMLVVLTQCTSQNDFEKGKQQLENQGYTDVKNTGWNAFCCAEKDQFSTGFICRDKAGNEVSGCICSDVLKGITIRFE